MKKVQIYDLVFVVVSALVIIGIHEFKWSEILIKYAVVFVLISYFAGRFVSSIESKKKKNQESKDK